MQTVDKLLIIEFVYSLFIILLRIKTAVLRCEGGRVPGGWPDQPARPYRVHA
jgi:hypothetical protein